MGFVDRADSLFGFVIRQCSTLRSGCRYMENEAHLAFAGRSDAWCQEQSKIDHWKSIDEKPYDRMPKCKSHLQKLLYSESIILMP